MTDLLATVRAPHVQDIIRDATHGGSESVTSAFTRILTAASATYTNLFRPTAFDLAGVRVAAIDLAEVATGGSPEADRQAAIMYLVARHTLVRHWWFDRDMLAHVPQAYRAWHRERIDALRDTPKRLCYDEFHRTGRAPGVLDQVVRDVRETRKLRIRLVLASQMAGDFAGDLIDLATRLWILGAGGKDREVHDLAAIFQLSNSLEAVLRHELTGPGPNGAPVLSISTGNGAGAARSEQLLINTLGPVELWALNTNPIDTALRGRLYERVDPALARRRLARRFPTGGAEDEVRRRIARAAEQGQDSSRAGSERAVLDSLVAELATTEQGDPP